MLTLSSKPKFVKGAAYGIRGSFLQLSFALNGKIDLQEFNRFSATISESDVGVAMSSITDDQPGAVISHILAGLAKLMEVTGQPFPLHFRPLPSATEEFVYLARCPRHLQTSVIRFIRLCLTATVKKEHFSGNEKFHWESIVQNGSLSRLFDLFSAGPPTPYSLHLLRAALARDIPCTQIEGETWRLGIGSKARLTTATMSDQTSVIGVNFARNKLAMARLMDRSGLPNLGGKIASSPEAAVKIANSLGYPVVVKPLALDGGIGVACDLRNDEDVAKHTASVLKQDKNVILQRFIEALDYRATVVDGKVIWLVRRVPGGLIGDGVSSIGALVSMTNAQPNRGSAKHYPLKPLKLDAEAKRYLNANKLTETSVLSKGQFVQLRGAANIASGGHHVPQASNAHPDNIHLAELAAEAFKLDFAGVDLLLPDITKSYRDTGGAVCEVNAQPAIVPAKLYAQVVEALVVGNGRIPIVMVVALGANSDFSVDMESLSKTAQKGLGLIAGGTITVNKRFIAASKGNCFDDLEVLFNHKRCQRVLCVVDSVEQLRHGLPVDKVDSLVIYESDATRDKRSLVMKLLPIFRGLVTYSRSASKEFVSQLPESVRDRFDIIPDNGHLEAIDARLR